MSAEALERIQAIERDRARRLTRGWVMTVFLGTFGFLSFVLGHQLGPAHLGWVEIALGGVAALAISAGIARPFAVRGRDRGADARFVLREGRFDRRILLYDGYAVVDEEVILPSTIDRIERKDDRLVLRYFDPVANGPLIRELSGRSRWLDNLQDALTLKSS